MDNGDYRHAHPHGRWCGSLMFCPIEYRSYINCPCKNNLILQLYTKEENYVV